MNCLFKINIFIKFKKNRIRNGYKLGLNVEQEVDERDQNTDLIIS